MFPCPFLSLFPSLFPFLRNRKNQTNGFVMRFFEGKRNLNGNKYLLFIKDIYINGYIGERDVCSLVPIFCSHTLIGLYLPCTACAPHRARSSFFLNKGKGIGSPICRAAPRGCRRPCTPSTNTARAEAGGIQGGPPPCAGGPGTRRFLAYLCLLSLREKVGRGLGRSAQKVDAGATGLAKFPRRGEASPLR